MQYLRGVAGPAVVLLAVVTLAMPARAAVTQGQVDDFEDGTLRNWHMGPNNPTPESNVSSGGPAGANDNYMRLVSNGGGAGGKMVVFNDLQQWSGDFLAAQVDEIQMQVNSFLIAPPPAGGQQTLDLRLILTGTSGVLCTVSDVFVAPGSGWVTAHFPLNAANLTGGSLSVLSSITEIDLVHSATPIFTRQSSPPVIAQLGVDNVRAITVPEPGTAGGMAMAGVLSISNMRRERRAGRHGAAVKTRT
jgi:hypothetical protein